MRIQSSELSLHASHARLDAQQERVELEVWRPAAAAPRPDTLSLSERALAAGALPSPVASTDNNAGAMSDAGLPATLSLIRQVLEDVLGIQIEIYQPDAGQGPATPTAEAPAPAPPARAPASGGGFELRRLHTREENEHLQVDVQGRVETADGRRIELNLHLDLQRQWRETRTETIAREGSDPPKRKDPLVINLGGGGAAFDSQRIDFDLDADGVAESIPNVTAASGYLALDRDGSGRIENGRELFGARSGNGFAELAALDDDGNGWIDETDAAWQSLRIWQRDASGQDHLQTLAQAGVGALHVGAVQGEFEYRDTQQAPLAEARATGLWLRESDGVAGSLQQLDLFV
jgi:hypothetical protein